MRPLPTHLIVFSSLALCGMLAVWLGVAGALVTDTVARGWYDVAKDWQTLIAALIALAAAAVAVRPVWRQLAEARWQSMQRSYEQLAARSRQLHQEREALYNLTSAIDIMVMALVSLSDLNPIGGITANTVLSVEGPENHLRSTIEVFKRELGPIWGSSQVQAARTGMLDQALRFCTELRRLQSRIVIGNRLSDAEITVHVVPLKSFKEGAFAAALILHEAIDAETARIGPMIAKLEADLLVLQ